MKLTDEQLIEFAFTMALHGSSIELYVQAGVFEVYDRRAVNSDGIRRRFDEYGSYGANVAIVRNARAAMKRLAKKEK